MPRRAAVDKNFNVKANATDYLKCVSLVAMIYLKEKNWYFFPGAIICSNRRQSSCTLSRRTR